MRFAPLEASVCGPYSEQQVRLARLLDNMTLSGSSPLLHHQYLWMRQYQVGDVVVETSTTHTVERDWRDAIGVLVRRYTVVLTDEEHDLEGHPQPGLNWVIATGRGEFTWHNASFVRVPVTKHERELFSGWASRCELGACLLGCARERWEPREGGCVRLILRTGSADPPPCQHKETRRGADAPLRHGSHQTEVCVACGMFRTHGHDAGRSQMSAWTSRYEYADRTRKLEDES